VLSTELLMSVLVVVVVASTVDRLRPGPAATAAGGDAAEAGLVEPDGVGRGGGRRGQGEQEAREGEEGLPHQVSPEVGFGSRPRPRAESGGLSLDPDQTTRGPPVPAGSWAYLLSGRDEAAVPALPLAAYP
jgi:hypothetical protein